MIQKRGVPGFAWNLEKRHRALGFRRTEEIYDGSIRRKVAQLPAVLLRQLITDEEGISKEGKFCRGAANKDLALLYFPRSVLLCQGEHGSPETMFRGFRWA